MTELPQSASPIVEALKEAGRIVVVAILPLLLDALTRYQVEQVWYLDWRIILTVTGIALLKALDKYIHRVGKEEKDPYLTRGLTRF